MNPQTQTPEFRRWFAGSVITNPDGSPMVVYHVSTYGKFTVFDKSEQRKGVAGYGFYFTDRKGAEIYVRHSTVFKAAFSWKGEEKAVNITPVYLRMTNPLVADDIRDVYTNFAVRDPGDFGIGRVVAGLSPDALTAVERAGYDGVVSKEYVVGDKKGAYRIVSQSTPGAIDHPVYVVFDPRQIKSATGNRGTFDPKDPDIRNPRRNPASVDKQYLEAVSRGDLATAQRMVDEAARKAGYTIGPVWRGDSSEKQPDSYSRSKRREFGIFTTPSRDIAKKYSGRREPRRFYVLGNKVLNLADDTAAARQWVNKWSKSFEEWIDRGSGEEVDAYDVLQGGRMFDYEGDWSAERWNDIQASAAADGYDAVILPDYDSDEGVFRSVVVLNDNGIKSADPIIRDDAGNVIPLSRRFNVNSDDIRNPRRPSQTYYVYTPADGNATRDPFQPYDLKRAKEVARNESMRLRDAGFPLEETVAHVNADTPKAETVWSCDAETCGLRNPLDPRSAKTQIATTVRTYRKAAPHLLGHVLDYGAGLGLGSDTLRESGLSVSSYEPFPARWQGRKPPTYTRSADIPTGGFQSVTSFSVLNVVDRKERDRIVREIARALAPGGIALVTARLRSDVESAARKRAGGEPGGWWISEKGEERYQKGFTQDELEKYLRGILGVGFKVERFPVLNGASVRITKSPEMKQNPVGDSRNLHWLVGQVSEPEDRVLDYSRSQVGDLYHLYDLVHAGNVLARVQDEAHLHRIMTEVEGLLDDEGVFLFDYEPGPVSTPELLRIAAQHFKEVGRVQFPGLQGTLYAARGPLNPEEARINAEKERRK